MVGRSKDSLDFASHRLWILFFRNDDHIVRSFSLISKFPFPLSACVLSLPISLYLVDTFTFGASATAAAAVSPSQPLGRESSSWFKIIFFC